MGYDDDLLAEFISESEERLHAVQADLLSLLVSETDPDPEAVNRVFRVVHSIKGEAGYFGLSAIGEFCHAMESVLAKVRESEPEARRELLKRLLGACDHVLVLLDAVESGEGIDLLAEAGAIREVLDQEPVALARAATSRQTDTQGGAAALAGRVTVDEFVRVKTSVLNDLMELSGELVLGRNRMVQVLEPHLERLEGIGPIVHQVSNITTNIQQLVMRMRLQPLRRLFNSLRRLVLEMSLQLGREMGLETSGEEVELDRTIIEGLFDPLIHLVRNCIDHGLEGPVERERAGKPRAGTIRIKAFHEVGMVNIVIQDDGRGVDLERVRQKALARGLVAAGAALSERQILDLVFVPGFSTAEVVTGVSGRGMGMDVVRANVERLGGTVELSSTSGRGTTVNLKVPLTVAIALSLIIEVQGQRFVLPLASLDEVVRLAPGKGSGRIENLRGAEVLRRRGKLLPVIRLADVLGIQRTFVHPADGSVLQDRRQRLADRREEPRAPEGGADEDRGPPPETSDAGDRRSGGERRQSSEVQRVLVLKVGNNRFGLLVDQIHTSEEIVIKPLSRFLQGSPLFSGATILGDGTISLILDPLGIAHTAGLRLGELRTAASDEETRDPEPELLSMLLFDNGTQETFAVPVFLISRIEKLPTAEIESVGERQFIDFRGSALPLVWLHEHLPIRRPPAQTEVVYVLIPKLRNIPVGIVVQHVSDTIETEVQVERETIREAGLLGSTIIDGKLVLLLDVFGLIGRAVPDRVRDSPVMLRFAGGPRVLLCDDDPFYRVLVQVYLEAAGCVVTAVGDGETAWAELGRHAFDAVVADTAMPGLDGFALLERIRASAELADLPVLVLASVLRGKEKRRTEEIGGSGYEHKLDKEGMLGTLASCLPSFLGGDSA